MTSYSLSVTAMRRALQRLLPGMHLWQVGLALACFGLPLLLYPLTRPLAGGAQWRFVDSWPGDRTVRRVAAGGDGRLFAVGSVGGLFMDGSGADWVRATVRSPRDQAGIIRVLDLAVNPGRAEELYAVIASPAENPRPMLYWSSDGGHTWQARSSLGPQRVQAITYSPNQHVLYIVTANDVLRGHVEENGRTFFLRDDTDIIHCRVATFERKTWVTRVMADDRSVNADGSTVLYIGTMGQGLRILYDGNPRTAGGIASSDQEATQYVQEGAYIHAIALHPLDPRRVYIGTDRGLYASEDDGRSWYHTAQALHREKVLALLVDPLDGAMYAGLQSGGVMRSEDDGATWAPLSRGMGHASVYSMSITGSEPRALYAGTDRGLWRLDLN